LNTARLNSKPKILYLMTRGILGGPHTHIFHLASYLCHEFDIHVGMGEKGPLWDRLQDKGIPVYHMPSMVRAISPFKDVKGLFEVMRIINEVRPNLISTHSSKAGIVGRLSASICKVPSVFTAHGWAFTEGVPDLKRLLYIRTERIAARWAEKIICVSEYDRQLALKYGVGKTDQLLTIHNGVPLITDDLLASPGESKQVRLIMVARFSDQKDHSLLIKAVSELNTKSSYVIDLVGDGPLLEKCKEQVNSMGIKDRVNFLGARTDVPELLMKSQAYLLISKWEGFPRSILEAMRAGLPVLASDVGGTRESVADGKTGFLLPRGDIDALKKRLAEIIDSPALRVDMGQSGRLRFLKNFTFDHMVAKTVSIYKDII